VTPTTWLEPGTPFEGPVPVAKAPPVALRRWRRPAIRALEVLKHYTEANGRAWDEVAPIHARTQFDRLLANFQDPDFSLLDATKRCIFGRLGVVGKSVAQLSCNNARELLSVKRLGAGRCVGFDIAPSFIEQGRALTAAAGEELELIACDVYEVSSCYDGSFDIVYVTIGALGWLPDLDAYFEVVARLLRPGGHIFVYEMHPIMDMFEPKAGLEVQYCYFREEPWEDNTGLDYYGKYKYESETMYWFHHKLNDVIGNCIGSGLALEHFEEHPHDISTVFKRFEGFAEKPPLCYTLVARKDEPAVPG